jgi:hypothetical protein
MPATVAKEIEESGCVPVLLQAPQAGLEMAHVFVFRRSELSDHLARLRKLLGTRGIIWVSWPEEILQGRDGSYGRCGPE